MNARQGDSAHVLRTVTLLFLLLQRPDHRCRCGTWSYTYNADGLRTEREGNTYTYSYVYNGGQLTHMTRKKNSTGATDTIWFGYDAEGPTFIKYNSTTYQYVTNLQGDVIALLDSSGNVVVEYTYDAWGKLLSTTGSLASTLGQRNPLRYRGYVFDHETGLYYLQSRYYDPEIGRFINADTLVSTKKAGMGCNVFTYCFNSPSNYVDTAGTDAIWIHEWDSAKGQGHTGLLVQDDDGNWFYFFWGPSSEDETEANIIKLIIGVENDAYYVSYDGDASQLNLHETENVVKLIQEISDSHNLNDRSEKVTNTVYLEGDFSKTHEYLNSLCGEDVECKEKYNLFFNNCVQKSLYALSLSDDRFSPYVIVETGDGVTMQFPSIHPNFEYSYIPFRLAR